MTRILPANLLAGLAALSALAACDVAPPVGDAALFDRLAGNRLSLTEPGGDPSEVLILDLGREGTGVMTADPFVLTFDWSVPQAGVFCLSNLRLGGMLGDNEAGPDCARAVVSGNRITLDWPEDSPDGRRSAQGTITPL